MLVSSTAPKRDWLLADFWSFLLWSFSETVTPVVSWTPPSVADSEALSARYFVPPLVALVDSTLLPPPSGAMNQNRSSSWIDLSSSGAFLSRAKPSVFYPHLAIFSLIPIDHKFVPLSLFGESF